jgi:ABC-type spermidine/putrescine transport system permease subunit II
MIGPGLARAFRGALGAVPLVVAALMIVPSLLVALLSFSGDTFIAFPPRTWGVRQYVTLLRAGAWHDPFIRSMTVAAVSSTVAVLVGAAATLALQHGGRGPARQLLQVLGIGPLLAPGVAYAVALYALFARLRMLGTVQAVVLAHVTVTVPFVFLIMGSAITKVPRELELAALSLGASRFEVWRDVTLRLLWPAIAASFIFAFVASFDETVITAFLGGIGFVTLPVAIFNSVRDGIDPVITAIATLLTAGTGAVLVIHALLRRHR